MNKEMIISSGDHDTRVAILEEDQVVEIFIERERQRGVVGNIYKGRVSKVLPGMQSSFVDIGLERDAFLYVTEVVNTVEEFDRLESGDDDEPRCAAVADRPADGRRVPRDSRRPPARRAAPRPAAARRSARAGREGIARRSRPRSKTS
jgi:ribonuclease G